MKAILFLVGTFSALLVVPAAADTYKITAAQALSLYNGLSNIDQPYTAIDKDNKQYQTRHKIGKDSTDRERVQWAMAIDLDHLRPIAARSQRQQQDDQMQMQADLAEADIAIAQAGCPGEGDKSAPSVECAKARRDKFKIASDDTRKADCLMDQIDTVDLMPIVEADMALKDNDLSVLSLSALLFFDKGQPIPLNPKCLASQ